MRGGTFREVKVGCLFDARDLAEVRAGRRELLHKHHEVHLGGPEPLGDRMYAAACAAGVTADGSNAISQGDGAPWVWHLVQLHWPAAREVLDFYHLYGRAGGPGGAAGAGVSAVCAAWARAVTAWSTASPAALVYRSTDLGLSVTPATRSSNSAASSGGATLPHVTVTSNSAGVAATRGKPRASSRGSQPCPHRAQK
jgi:hypothetical protein